jgi:hypothetical protein
VNHESYGSKRKTILITRALGLKGLLLAETLASQVHIILALSPLKNPSNSEAGLTGLHLI